MDDEKDSQEACLEAIHEINADMVNVQKNVEEIGKLQKKILNAIRKDDAVQNMRSELIDNITMLARRILLKLTRQEKVNDTEINPLSRKFFDVWNEYLDCQIQFQNQRKKMLVRQYQIIGVNKTDEELEEILDSNPEGLPAMCTDLQEQIKAKIQLKVVYILSYL